MRHVQIQGATAFPGAPAGWNEKRDGPCGALPVREVGNPRGGSGFCESAWLPTEAELDMLKAGKPVILRVIGWQVPVALYVSDEPVEDLKPASEDLK